MVMNIRYADTPAQKELKRVTAERRQFRTNEYNIGAYGTAHVGMPVQAYGIPTSYRRPYPATIPYVVCASHSIPAANLVLSGELLVLMSELTMGLLIEASEDPARLDTSMAHTFFMPATGSDY